MDSLADILTRQALKHFLRPGENDETIKPLGAGICVIARETAPQSWTPIDIFDARSEVVDVAKKRLAWPRSADDGYLFAILIPIQDRSLRHSEFSAMAATFADSAGTRRTHRTRGARSAAGRTLIPPKLS